MGALGPSISALLLTYILKGKTKVKELLKEVLKWRVSIIWWIIGLYGWWFLCSILALFLNDTDISKISFSFLVSIINIPAIIFILQLPLMVGMFGEEVGWRGFALPRLLEKYNPIIVSFILAIPWLLWHSPLFVFNEWTGESSLGYFLLKYFLRILPLSIIFTWFFQRTKGSLLLIIILYKSFNLTFNAYKIALGLNEKNTELISNLSLISLWIIAVVITVYYLKTRNNKLSSLRLLP